MPSFDLDVGLGSVTFIRNFLKKCQFRGLDFDYIVSRGFFTRTFTLKGKTDILHEVRDLLNATEGENPKCPPGSIDLGGGYSEQIHLGLPHNKLDIMGNPIEPGWEESLREPLKESE